MKAVSLLPVLVTLLVGCDRWRESPTESQMPDVARYVTERVASSLTPDGHFRLAAPHAPDDLPIISPERSRELAAAYLRSWGRTRVGMWGWERGAPLMESDVHPGERVFFAETPHARFPDTYHPAFQRMYGPMYLVPMLAKDETVAYLAISAYSTDLKIRENGTIDMPAKGGSYFFPVAVAPDPRQKRFHFVPVGPEEAAAYVAERTGVRIDAVPRLVLRDGAWHPATAQWRLTLERPVRIRRQPSPERPGVSVDDAPVAVREVFVGPNREIRIASARQPVSGRVVYPTGPARAGEVGAHAVHALPRRAEMPTEFDTVVLEEG